MGEMITVLKSKIHMATVTDANENYEGSIEISKFLMDAIGMQGYEQVHVLNASNGQRVITYTIPNEEQQDDGGIICVNGPAAKHFCVGDKVVIISYALISTPWYFTAHTLYVDEDNRIDKVKDIPYDYSKK